MRSIAIALIIVFVLPGFAQEDEEWSGRQIDWEAEIKINYRDSSFEEFRLSFPFPDDFLDPDQGAAWLRTPDEGSSLEISNIALSVDAQLGPKLDGRVLIHLLDLYSRNPSSIEDRLFIREAWLRIGHADEEMTPLPGTTVHARLGRQARFTKRLDRRLESYGLWGTAVGRFESTKIELGGSFGPHLYWRGSWGNGNPLFMRDTNALAGDNGVPEGQPGNPASPPFEAGFPILYDTWEQEVAFGDTEELGIGIGFRWVDERHQGIDVLAWHFERDLAEDAELRGTFYGGDIEILEGAGIPLPFSGSQREENGVNLRARYAGFHFFGQWIEQEIAGLERDGYEAAASYRFRFPALMVIGDEPAFRWLELVVRASEIDNHFWAPPMFVAPTFVWDWKKVDFGFRLGILRDLDLTIEYSRHDMILGNGSARHPDELLVTLRWAIGS